MAYDERRKADCGRPLDVLNNMADDERRKAFDERHKANCRRLGVSEDTPRGVLNEMADDERCKADCRRVGVREDALDNKKCTLCKKENASSSCTGCGALYCSKSCQGKDWKEGHKKECLKLPTGMYHTKFEFPKDCVSTTPFVTVAELLSSNDKAGAATELVFYHRQVRKASDVVHLLRSFNNVIQVDCCIAVQLILAGADKMERPGMFGLGAGISWLMMDKAKQDATLSGDHALNPGYFCAKNKELMCTLQEAGGSAQGQWLLGPCKYGRWLGQTFDAGLQRQPLAWWHARLIESLQRTLAKYASYANTHMLALRAALDEGALALDAYVVYRSPIVEDEQSRLPDTEMSYVGATCSGGDGE